ncbi:MAG: hypothetical protein WC069_07080 [Candidatus Shapirobacteria bacterium]
MSKTKENPQTLAFEAAEKEFSEEMKEKGYVWTSRDYKGQCIVRLKIEAAGLRQGKRSEGKGNTYEEAFKKAIELLDAQ